MEIELTEQEQRVKPQLILPLDDLATITALDGRVDEFDELVDMYKFGLESHTRFGMGPVYNLQQRGKEVFLDLKFHDIPRTVRGAAHAAAEHGVYMFNVHASGGIEMMQYALEGANRVSTRVPRVIAVTLLTSINGQRLNEELGIPGTVPDRVKLWAENARKAGLDGIVCAAADVAALKASVGFPEGFLFVTPGIKGPDGKVGADQARVDTPYGGIRGGSTHLVVGTAIIDHPSAGERRHAAYAVLQDMARAYR